MKNFFKSSIFTSIVLFVLGLLLIFESEATITTISYIIGAILMAAGAFAFVRYIRNNKIGFETSELDVIKEKYAIESDFRQKIALKKQIEILEEQKQKMVRAFHDEMSTLEEEAANMQKQFAEGILVKTQLVTKIVIKF